MKKLNLIVILFLGIAFYPSASMAQEFSFEYAYTIGKQESDSAQYLFSGPKALVTDSKGRVYIADWRSKIIKIFNQKGRYVTSVGRSGRGPGEFLSIEDLAIDDENNLYVLDRILRRVTVFTNNLKDVETYNFDADFTDSIAIYPLKSGDHIILATGKFPADNIKVVYTFDNKFQNIIFNYLQVYPALFGSNSPFFLAIIDSPHYNSTFYGNGSIAICHSSYSGKTALIAPGKNNGQPVKIIGRWKPENYNLLEGKSTMEYIQADIKGLVISGGRRGSFTFQKMVSSKALVGNTNYFLNFLRTVQNNENISGVRIYNEEGELLKEVMLNDTELNLMKDNGRTALVPLHMDDNNNIYIADYTQGRGYPVVRVVKMVAE